MYTPQDAMRTILFDTQFDDKDENTFFGEIDNTTIKMPKVTSDKRNLTWAKLIKNYCADRLKNKPQNQQWCWLVEANHTAGGTGSARWSCKHKISSDGTGNWYVVCFIIFFIYKKKYIIKNFNSFLIILIKARCRQNVSYAIIESCISKLQRLH